MHKEPNISAVGRNWRKLHVISICIVLGLSSILAVSRAITTSNSQVLVNPDFAKVVKGQCVVVTFNLTNFKALFGWSVAVKYNGSIVSITSVDIPPDNVFSGHAYTPLLPAPGSFNEADIKDSLNYTFVGANLSGDDKVSVTNGVLFTVNFTVVGEGSTTIVVATESNAVHVDQYVALFTECMDENLVSYTDFQTGSCTLVTGAVNAPPTAYFTVIPPAVDNVTNLALNQNPGSATRNYAVTYKDYPTSFNASQSYDPDGNITKYIWDFGDGSNETLPPQNGSFVVHTYRTVGSFKVTLTVVDNGNQAENLSAAESKPYSFTVISGLVLPYYDWLPFIYAVAALVAVGLAYYVFRETRRYIRTRRETRSQTTPSPRQSS